MRGDIKIQHWQPQLSLPQQAVFILGSRDISAARVAQLTQQLGQHLAKPLVWGLLAEKAIIGLEQSPQFASLSQATLFEGLKIAQRASSSLPSIEVLLYSQKDTPAIIASHKWTAVIGINGSWHRAFHYREEYQAIQHRKIPYKLVSAFINQDEAIKYAQKISAQNTPLEIHPSNIINDRQIMELVDKVAAQSFDHTWQTGAVLVQKNQILLTAHNKVVPFETYSLLHGSSKEKNRTPPQDLNHYDTNHAEVELILQALQAGLNIDGSTLYLNLMPCPTCARMLIESGIKTIIYKQPHQADYVTRILCDGGITIKEYK
ncbi:MAG TPA: deaminase [Candidatus Woesebacteria bacterium]|nr:deaminase [Candidatus Woesebacteria bacterium]